jgi:hypothetical protein
MSKVVPDTYTVEFGQRVARSFVELGHFAQKTDFRLEHLEKHLGEAFAEIEALKTAKRKAKKFPLKTVLVLYAGMVIGGKLRERATRDKVLKVYDDAVAKAQEAFESATEAAKAKQTPETPEQGPYVDEVLRGTPNDKGRITPEHDVTR